MMMMMMVVMMMMMTMMWWWWCIKCVILASKVQLHHVFARTFQSSLPVTLQLQFTA
jgi:hypothetical protein